ncbi:MAG: metal ABC transporter permease [Candidatus Aminicenantales bacterium]
MQALLTYGFLHRALLAGIFIALACAVLGVFLLLRRDAMIGHGLAHITFAGVALGLFLRVMPLAVALVFSILASLVIMKLKESAGLHGDTAIAVVSSVAMALGIVLATMSRNFSVALLNYLFGEILAIDPIEVWLSMGLAGAVVALVIGNYRKFMYLTFDRESAMVSGIRVRRLDTLITILASITIVLGMRVVGILLVSALIVIPAAAGLQLASNFKTAIILSCGVAFVSVIAGLILAFFLDLPVSGMIVLVSFVLFGFFFLLRRMFKI